MPLALLLLNLLPNLLGSIPGISAKLKGIIGDVAGATSEVLKSGVTSGPSFSNILAAWAGVISVLQSDPNLNQKDLGIIAQLQKAVQAAVLEDAVAAKQVDWTVIAHIEPKQ